MDCNYCQKGKKFNTTIFGDTYIESYILGNELTMYVLDNHYNEDSYDITIIKKCPFCGRQLYPAPDEVAETEEV